MRSKSKLLFLRMPAVLPPVLPGRQRRIRCSAPGSAVSQRDAALQMRGLSVDRCVESYHVPTQAQCRKLGANSARAIKKMPFK